MSHNKILNDIKNMDFENTFNPYYDRCPIHDNKNAPKIRRLYLKEMLDRACDIEIDSIWVGRDLGYRGGRRTGLALTDDINFSKHLNRWGLEPRQITNGTPVSERTASIVWDILDQIEKPIFLWNVFPLHPFENGNPFSNRAHNSLERNAGREVLIKVIQHIQPRRIIAIGNDAFNVLTPIYGNSGKLFKVRHPSYGGQTEFINSMHDLYKPYFNL